MTNNPSNTQTSGQSEQDQSGSNSPNVSFAEKYPVLAKYVTDDWDGDPACLNDPEYWKEVERRYNRPEVKEARRKLLASVRAADKPSDELPKDQTMSFEDYKKRVEECLRRAVPNITLRNERWTAYESELPEFYQEGLSPEGATAAMVFNY